MISVLIATYNGERFIKEQLDSIRMQTVPADEVYILDDCSTDKTFEIISNYIDLHHLSTWKLLQNNSNMGHYQTFLKLCLLANGDYIFFSDQDDIWFNNKIECLMQELNKKEVGMVFCKSDMINEEGHTIKSLRTDGTTHNVSLERLLKAWPSGYQSAYKSYLLKDILQKGYQENPYFQFHDVLFGMMCNLYGQVLEVNLVLDQHRVHQHNVTLSSKSHSFHNTLESRLNYYEKMIGRYKAVLNAALKMNASKEKIEIIEHFVELYQFRLQFIKDRSLSSLRGILSLRKYINGTRGLASDVVYAIRIHTILKKRK